MRTPVEKVRGFTLDKLFTTPCKPQIISLPQNVFIRTPLGRVKVEWKQRLRLIVLFPHPARPIPSLLHQLRQCRDVARHRKIVRVMNQTERPIGVVVQTAQDDRAASGTRGRSAESVVKAHA